MRWRGRVHSLAALAGTAAGAAIATPHLAGAALLAAVALGVVGSLAPALSLALYAAGNAVLCAGFQIGAVRVAPETIFLGWILFFALARTLADPGASAAAWRRVRAPAAAAIAFSAVATFSALRAGVDREAVEILSHAPVWIANAVSLPLLAAGRHRLRLVCAALVVTSAALGLLTLAIPSALESLRGGAFLSEYRNPYAHFLSLGLLLSISFALLGPPPFRLPAHLATLLLAAAMIETGSRAAWFSAAAGGAVLLLSRAGRLAPRGSGVAAALLLVGGTAVALHAEPVRRGAERAAERFATIFDWSRRSSNRYRLEIAEVSLRMAREDPILGSGPGRFRESAESKRAGLRSLSKGVHATDNEYARTLGETGLLGLLLLLGFGAASAKRLRRTLRDAKDARDAWAPAAGAALLAFLAVLAAFEDLAYAGTFWFLLGAVHACSLPEEEP